MKFNEMPFLGAEAKEVKDVKDIQAIGQNAGAYSVQPGTTYVFPNDETPLIAEIPVGNNNTAAYVACVVDGEPTWLSIGSLRRMDASGAYLDETRKKLAQCANFFEAWKKFLKGQSLETSSDLKTVEFYKFDRTTGERLDEKRQANVAVFI